MNRHIIAEKLPKITKVMIPWQIFLLTICTYFILDFFSQSFKAYFFVALASVFLLTAVLRKPVVAVLIVLFVTSPFIEPGKYYSFNVIEPRQVHWEPAKEFGMIEAYGLVTSDVLCIFFAYLSFRDMASSDVLRSIKRKHQNYSIKIILCFLLLFFVLLLGSSLFVSGYSTFSTVVTFQYFKMILFGLTMYYQLRKMNSFRSALSQIILGTLASIHLITLWQFVQKVLSFGLNQKSYIGTTEEMYLLYRPAGPFLHANQLAFVCVVLLLTLLILKDKLLYSRPLFLGTVIFSTLATIIVSQSRTVWIFVAIFFLKTMWQQSFGISSRLRKRFKGKEWLLTFFVLSTFLFIVFPRIYYSMYTDNDGSLTIRKQMISDAISAIVNSPYFGFGAGTNVLVMLSQAPSGYILDFPFAVHAAYLQVALEAGILGAVFFFMPWIVLYKMTNALDNFFLIKETATSLRTVIRSAVFFILMYYCLQPHSGRIEFFYLGLLMFTSVWAIENRMKK